MFPINLVWLVSDFRYEIKTSLPVIWLENIDKKNPGWFVRNELNWTGFLRKRFDNLVEEDVEEFVHGLILQMSDNAR